MFSRIEPQTVIGALKAARSQDPDVLFSKKEELLAEPRKAKLITLVPIIAGILMTLTILGAVIGIPLLIIGIWLRMRVGKNIRTIEETYREFIGEGPASAPGLESLASVDATAKSGPAIAEPR